MNTEQFQRFSKLFSLRKEDFPYSSHFVARVQKLRSLQVDRCLFFDVLLAVIAGIQDAAVYFPPSDLNELKTLFLKIDESGTDELKQHCCFYYILKDWNKSKEFAEQVLLPKNFRTLMDGYYEMDHMNYESALNCFLHPSVIPNFADKILETLYQQKQYRLSVRFVQTISPPLDTYQKQSTYILSLAQLNFVCAYQNARKFQNSQELWTEMVRQVLASENKKACKSIIALPLSQQEQQLLRDILLQDKGFFAQKLLLCWLIQLGELTEAKKLIERLNNFALAPEDAAFIDSIKTMVP
ncbi:fungal protein [Schizosaccharomyces japonicus yFS275]|uniref:Fungal protein n=1 Tax=Schizosaccharomyces japonicus (strain yFS275 / FY16936) TaxID=402676 RepID=B6JZ11_SCHJY|nr:fungal protein [Schizosaccharomyces japonicus yFS275]EEB06779.1 fungal protein [Schizosaccharomyces japonicus yFS275]